MSNRRTRLFHPRHWPTWLGVGVLRLIALLPMPLIALLGSGLGMLLYAVHAERRRITLLNLSRCFPELSTRQHRALARAHFRGFAQAALDIGIAWWSRPRRLMRLVRFRQREHYDQALRDGRKIILLAPHFLGLEIGGMRLSLERNIVTVFRHPDNELLRRVMMRGRKRFGMVLVEHNKPLTTLIKQVRSGKPFYYLPDQDPGRRNYAFVPFFGISTATFAVLGRLAMLTNAVVIPCWTRQLSWGRGYEMTFEAPLENFPTGEPSEDARRMNAAIEATVRQAPSQYFWVHKRFKTRPPGEAPFY
jgi:Kdo2-lipid IVA lauroyltransferase/acyltransferase